MNFDISSSPKLQVASLALARRQPGSDLACLAAKWLAGTVAIKPTSANAALIFGVGVKAIAAQIDGPATKRSPPDRLAAAWNKASRDQRRVFAAAVGSELLALLDDITAAPAAAAKPVKQLHTGANGHASLFG